MSKNTDTTRYYVGDSSDLDGLSRAEVEVMTYEFRCDAEVAIAESIDDAHGNVTILTLEYTTSRALKSVDPIAWRCLLSDSIAEVDLSDYQSDEWDEDE